MATKKKKKAKKKAKKKKKKKKVSAKESRPTKLLAPAQSRNIHYDPKITDIKEQSPFCVIPAKRLVGRPTLYEDQFCQMLIDHMAGGFSFESFAGVIAVAESTIYLWAKEHKQFSEAKERGFAACRHWWENAGIMALAFPTKMFNSTVWSRNMNARFPSQWRGDSAPPVEEDDNLEFVVEFA